jgi:hypothetical protein
MQTPTPTTELEAVNTMLRAISESPTSSLDIDVGVDVITAKATLASISRQVQSEGWLFNTEHDYPLPMTVDGEIPVPTNALTVDVNRRKYPFLDPVLRGNRIYDRENHTYKFEQPLEARIIFLLPFSDMPETARSYVTIRAARVFQDDSLGSDALHKFKLRDELMARVHLLEDQSEDADLNFITDDPQFNPQWSV